MEGSWRAAELPPTKESALSDLCAPNEGLVRSLDGGDVEALLRFFSALEGDETVDRFFRPHPFDRETAERICLRQGIVKDEYFALFEGGEITAYGMLRGLDEDYLTPAFGVCVRADHRGKGLGRVILDHAIALARCKGAPGIVLKVSDENQPARHLYESAGFTFEGTTPDGSQLLGMLRFDES